MKKYILYPLTMMSCVHARKSFFFYFLSGKFTKQNTRNTVIHHSQNDGWTKWPPVELPPVLFFTSFATKTTTATADFLFSVKGLFAVLHHCVHCQKFENHFFFFSSFYHSRMFFFDGKLIIDLHREGTFGPIDVRWLIITQLVKTVLTEQMLMLMS